MSIGDTFLEYTDDIVVFFHSILLNTLKKYLGVKNHWGALFNLTLCKII